MELELKDYLVILKKRIWMIVSVVLLACVASGTISMFLLNPVYQASTKLIVNKSNDAVGLEQLDINSVNLNIRLIDTYKEVIKTPAIMNAVVEGHPELGLDAKELISKVQVSSVNNTQVMTLVVEDESYERAAKIVNAVSAVFQREISNIMSVDNVSILNEADVNDTPAPVRPNVKLNIAIAFVVSLMVAVGIAFLLEYLDDTIKTEKDIEQVLGLPPLALVAKTTDEDFKSNGSKSSTREVTESRAAYHQ